MSTTLLEREAGTAIGPSLPPPMGMLAELTHRCPLMCPYCSNPVALDRKADELTTDEWKRVFDEAAALGVLQLHLSGGEPLSRPDIVELTAHASGAGLYTNLITSAVALNDKRMAALKEAGLDHVQISFQDAVPDSADTIGGYKGGHARKLAAARVVRAHGVPLTVNAVMHRRNLDRMTDMIALAVELGAHRLEVANVQYYGWALKNRAALMPTRQQALDSARIVQEARERLKGRLVIDYVAPDYYARFPKACMGGWGQRSLNVTPAGRVLPCHAAESIPELSFENVRDRSLRDIWLYSSAFEAFRGTDWMIEPCRSCERREQDWGGCRCQAFAFAGDARAADPACSLSDRHQAFVEAAELESGAEDPPDFDYRRFT